MNRHSMNYKKNGITKMIFNFCIIIQYILLIIFSVITGYGFLFAITELISILTYVRFSDMFLIFIISVS